MKVNSVCVYSVCVCGEWVKTKERSKTENSLVLLSLELSESVPFYFN